jgi:hypothetical protein
MSTSKLCRDSSKSFCHAGGSNYFKPFALKPLAHHRKYRAIVIYQQNSVRSACFGGSHGVRPLVTDSASLDAIILQVCAILNSRPILGNVLFGMFDRAVMG